MALRFDAMQLDRTISEHLCVVLAECLKDVVCCYDDEEDKRRWLEEGTPAEGLVDGQLARWKRGAAANEKKAIEDILKAATKTSEGRQQEGAK